MTCNLQFLEYYSEEESRFFFACAVKKWEKWSHNVWWTEPFETAALMKKAFAYDFDVFLDGDKKLNEVELRRWNLPLSTKFVLFLSPDIDDDSEDMKLAWDWKKKKMSSAPGALAHQQLCLFKYERDGKFSRFGAKHYVGDQLHYQLYVRMNQEDECGIVMREFCDPARKNVAARFMHIPYSKLWCSATSNCTEWSENDYM